MERTVIYSVQDFGWAVRSARKEAGLTQAQLAQRCGCSQRFVSEVERGKQTAELGRALRLLAELGVPLEAGGNLGSIDGRAEVRYAVVRASESIDAAPKKHKKLSEYLAEARKGE